VIVGGELQLADLIRLTLYQDLKSDIDTENKFMFFHRTLTTLIQNEADFRFRLNELVEQHALKSY